MRHWLLPSVCMCAALLGCNRDRAEGGTGSTALALRRANDCGDLEKALKADAKAKVNAFFDAQDDLLARYGMDGAYVGRAPTAAPDNSAGEGAVDDGGGEGAPRTGSDTNVQVKGVDEADIVKTDETRTYLYVLHGASLHVVKAWPAPDLSVAERFDIEGSPSEMFVSDGKIVVFSTVDGGPIYTATKRNEREPFNDGQRWGAAEPGVADFDGGGYYGSPLTKVTLLHLEGTKPVRDGEFYFEGSYLSSRRQGKHVRVVLSGYAFGPPIEYYPDTSGIDPSAQDEDRDTLLAKLRAAFESLRKKNLATIERSTLQDWLPYAFVKSGTGYTSLPPSCEDYWLPPEKTTEYGYTQVASFDLDDPDATPDIEGIVGAVDTVYSSKDAMYLAARGWNDPGWAFAVAATRGGAVDDVVGAPSEGGSSDSGEDGVAPARAALTSSPELVAYNYTLLHKFDVASDPTSPTYVASGSVPGEIINQFALDESAGVLRIATTQDRWPVTGDIDPPPLARPVAEGVVEDLLPTDAEPGSSSGLYTLREKDGQLVVIGGVEGLAPTERIMSVRYVGSVAYVVTFRQVDPLFAIDVSDPKNVSVLGELKIPGFSSYMHPLGDGHLLTIGQDADADGRVTGLALQVFDVTNPRKPRQIHKLTYSGNGFGYSEAATQHKAFTFFADRGLLAFPYVSYDPADAFGMKSTLEVFEVSVEGGIKKKGAVDHTALFGADTRGYCGGYFSPDVRRGVFIEDVVYSISYGGIIASDVDNVEEPVVTLPLESPYRADLPYCGESPVAGG